MGFAQHDAQEFMDFLLDGLHEVRSKTCVVPLDILNNWLPLTPSQTSRSFIIFTVRSIHT